MDGKRGCDTCLYYVYFAPDDYHGCLAPDKGMTLKRKKAECEEHRPIRKVEK